MTEAEIDALANLAPKRARYQIVEALKKAVADKNALYSAIVRTLDANGHLADGECCSLIDLKRALRNIGAPWMGDEIQQLPTGEKPCE